MNEQLVLKCNNVFVMHEPEHRLVEIFDETGHSLILQSRQWNELVDYIIKYRPRI